MDARALAQRRATRNNLVTGGLLFGFVFGVFFFCTRAVKQGEISEAELEAFKRERAAKLKEEQ